MAISATGIEYSELAGSPDIDITMDGTEARRDFWLPVYSSWIGFVSEIVGVWTILGGLANGTCSFNQPMPFPGYTNLVPSRVKVSPKNPNSLTQSAVASFTATNDYTGGAKVSVQYKSLYNTSQQRIDLPGVPNGTYLTYEEDLGAEYITPPGRSFAWMESVGTPTQKTPTTLSSDSSPGILVPTGAYTLTWDRVLIPPWGAIRAARGKVNSASFLSAPAGTVLFLGAQITRQFQFTNDGGFWRVQYKFAESSKSLNSGSQVGWNYFYREKPISGENWCLIGALPSEGATDGGDPALNTAASQAQFTVEFKQGQYDEAVAQYGQNSPQATAALSALQTAQAAYLAAESAAEAAGGGLYPPPYQSADFTQLFQMGGGLVCL